MPELNGLRALVDSHPQGARTRRVTIVVDDPKDSRIAGAVSAALRIEDVIRVDVVDTEGQIID